ncbi:hypothetical protein D3C86_2108170 [compost metagenome]
MAEIESFDDKIISMREHVNRMAGLCMYGKNCSKALDWKLKLLKGYLMPRLCPAGILLQPTRQGEEVTSLTF